MAVTRILIVDDEEDPLNAWARMLRDQGYSVRTAHTALSALKLCEEHNFEVVILDQFMPTMKGTELLTRIRKNQPMIRSILVSGKLDTSSEERTLISELREKVEVDDYMHKPVSNQRLIEAIEALNENTPSSSWKDFAKKTIKARKATVSDAKTAGKRLNKLRKKR